MTYIDGFVTPVPVANRDAYRDLAERAAAAFKEYGALEVVECWSDELPEGKLTDFRMAVKAEAGEAVVFSWTIWPSKEVRDAGHAKMMNDPRFPPPSEMPFDGKRMFWGGFTELVRG